MVMCIDWSTINIIYTRMPFPTSLTVLWNRIMSIYLVISYGRYGNKLRSLELKGGDWQGGRVVLYLCFTMTYL